MTDLLYQLDSMVREFDASVVALHADEGAVALDRTAFYPGGGGQPCDTGVLLLQDRSAKRQRLPLRRHTTRRGQRTV